ncbi:MAG: hypothetical protein ACP5SP_06950 [Caldisericum sp.]|uniref:hypothetical protein n=1 Tax=Caldisericum sp. TaxID=2499687 RepID=UPI003D12A5AE
MRISKSKAIKLIDEKTTQFKNLLENATYENRFAEAYYLAYNGSKDLLASLFSEDDAKKFEENVNTGAGIFFVGEDIDFAKELQDYKKRINKCITQLEIYRERVQNFWGTEKTVANKKPKIVPFISMSFSKSDKNISQYFMGILTALKIHFETGERYSKDNISEKVKKRIVNSGLLIIIFVKRDKLETGEYITPSWLIKERGVAQGANKDVIVLVEKGIDEKHLAGLDYEKEIIYFERDNVKVMEEATIKFLEALKEHKLI